MNGSIATHRLATRFALLLVLAVGACKADAPPPVEVRVAWQTAWATQGQVIEAMSHTNIPALYGVQARFVPFEYAPAMNDAAVAGQLDVTNLGIVPAINLLARDSSWVIVARVADFVIATMAAPGSEVRTVADMRGKAFGVPLGAGSHPYALQLLRDHGLSFDSAGGDVSIRDTSPTEMPAAMTKGTIQAAAVWEPTLSALRAQGATTIDSVRYVGFVVARKEFAQSHPDELVGLLKAYAVGSCYVAAHRAETDQWFSADSHIDTAVLKTMQDIEPNLGATDLKDVTLSIGDDDLTLAQQVSDIMSGSSPALIARQITIRAVTDTTYVERAQREIVGESCSGDRIKVGETSKTPR